MQQTLATPNGRIKKDIVAENNAHTDTETLRINSQKQTVQ